MKSEHFERQANTRIACLVVGFNGKITHYKIAIANLLDAGYNVVAYEYESGQISQGQPQATLDLIETITQDFLSRSKTYETVLYAGASLGAFIAYNIQRRDARKTRGMYATAGVRLSYCVFHALVFRPIRNSYIKNGYDETALRSAWKNVEVEYDSPPVQNKPFVVVMGVRDKIVNYKEATKTLKHWKDKGQNIEILQKKLLGHTGTIRWYKKNIPTMLKEVELLQ